MLRPTPSLLHALTLLASCTTVPSDPGDVILDPSTAADSSASDGEPTTLTPTDGATQGDTTTTDDSTTSTTSSSTTTTSTTDDTTLAATTDDTTGVPLRCGDGHVDPGEICDEGHESNSNSGKCTLACQKATCGDSLVWEGYEECDHGNNNHGQWGGCMPDCSLADHCGDGEKNGPEECDLGDFNGTSEHLIDGVACSPTCYHEALIVFLSSQPVSAALDGANGAHKHCQALAVSAGLYGGATFRAWISDLYSDPASYFEPAIPDLPYALLSGKRIAKDRAALLTSGPEDGITMTEYGETIYEALVWTATKPDGYKLDEDLDCDNWQQASPLLQASVGRSGVDKTDDAAWQEWKAGQHWTTFKTVLCSLQYRLYCFEQ